METALNIATYLFMLTFLSGVGLLGYILISVYHYRRPLPRPKLERPPARALERAGEKLELLKAKYYRSGPGDRVELTQEIRRLESRIQQIRQRTTDEQYDYVHLFRKLEKKWEDWKELSEKLAKAPREERAKQQKHVAQAVKAVLETQARLDQEWKRVDTLDHLHVEELAAQGVIEAQPNPWKVRADRSAQAPGVSAEPAWEASLGDLPPLSAAHSSGPSSAQLARQPSGRPSAPAAPVAALTERPAPFVLATKDESQGRKNAHGGESFGLGDLNLGLEDMAGETGLWADPVPEGFADQGRFPLAVVGVLSQAGMADPARAKSAMRYTDEELSLEFSPQRLMVGADFQGTDFSGVRFTGAHRYKECDFTGGDLAGVLLPRAEQPHRFIGCRLRGARMAGCRMDSVVFSDCDLAATDWSGAVLHRVKFVNCDVTGTVWDKADLGLAVFSAETAAGADFSRALTYPRIISGGN
ncbi:MAG: pentapeptide repeat-containing protein [Deltaproteobacteria bacterium]|nr:pentapeptide repeat-containing protein [Deltaproteobacteria bacterium]